MPFTRLNRLYERLFGRWGWYSREADLPLGATLIGPVTPVLDLTPSTEVRFTTALPIQTVPGGQSVVLGGVSGVISTGVGDRVFGLPGYVDYAWVIQITGAELGSAVMVWNDSNTNRGNTGVPASWRAPLGSVQALDALPEYLSEAGVGYTSFDLARPIPLADLRHLDFGFTNPNTESVTAYAAVAARRPRLEPTPEDFQGYPVLPI